MPKRGRVRSKRHKNPELVGVRRQQRTGSRREGKDPFEPTATRWAAEGGRRFGTRTGQAVEPPPKASAPGWWGKKAAAKRASRRETTQQDLCPAGDFSWFFFFCSPLLLLLRPSCLGVGCGCCWRAYTDGSKQPRTAGQATFFFGRRLCRVPREKGEGLSAAGGADKGGQASKLLGRGCARSNSKNIKEKKYSERV
jgi:hypothetical protein